jgi:hypothetical protein
MSLDPIKPIEFTEESEYGMKYERVVVSDDSDSDEDESLEVVVQKVNSRTSTSEPAKPRPQAQRMLTPQRGPRPIIVKPKLSGANREKRRVVRSQLGPENPTVKS